MVRKVLVLTSMTRSELRPPVPSTVLSSSSIFMRLSLSYFDLKLLVQCAKMDPLSTLKKIRKIIRTTTDRELVRLIFDLQKEVFAIESHNLEFASELRASNNSWT